MPQSSFDLARIEYGRGSYADCYRYAKSAIPRSKSEAEELRSLICDCLQYGGAGADAVRMAESALLEQPAPKYEATYWGVIGRHRLEKSEFEGAAEALRKGMQAAQKASDLISLSFLQQVWLVTVSPTLGTGLRSAVREAYRTAIHTADVSCLAGFHIRLTRLEAQRGAFDQAMHHLDLAESLLRRCDNLHLEALFHVNKSCLLGTIGALEPARKCAEQAASLADKSGNLRLSMAAAANVAHITVSAGDLTVAEPWMRKATKAASTLDVVEMAFLETMACYSLTRGDFAGAVTTLARARQAFEAQYGKCATSSESYSLVTELYLHRKLGNTAEQSHLLRTLRQVADNQDNWYSRFYADFAEAESFFDSGDLDAASLRVVNCLKEPPTHMIHWVAVNRMAARALWVSGHQESARRRLARACASAATTDTRLSWAEALRELRATAPTAEWIRAYSLERHIKQAQVKFRALMEHPVPTWFETTKVVERSFARDPLDGFEDAIAILDATEHMELWGRETLATVVGLGVTHSAALIARTDSGIKTLAQVGESTSALSSGRRADTTVERFAMGRVDGKDIELVLEPKSDVRSRFAIAGLRRVLDAARALKAQKKDQQRLGALWQPEVIVEEPDAVFSSPQTIELMQTARKVAATTLPVLLMGPTGTGKEVIARAIHRASPRAGQIFLPFNCSAVPRDMIESQLFGSKRGAFTGATDDSLGVIRTAEGGTLFLDEIGELSMDLQPKLLRFLETNEVHPLGEGKPIKVDVRVIAATNADLEEMIQQKTFREDLYYRLNIVRFHMPTLAERREEIPALATHLLRRFEMDEKKHSIKISDELMEYLLLYKWPGNVRQLSNELRKMVAMVNSGDTLLPEHIAPAIRATRKTVPVAEGEAEAAPLPEPPAQDPAALTLRLDQPMPGAIEALERAMIEHAIARADGKIEEAARLLGISRKGLFLKRRRWHTGGEPPSHSA